MTIRKDARWAKATKTANGWTIALGFRGNFKATHIRYAGENRTLGAVIALNWLKDQ